MVDIEKIFHNILIYHQQKVYFKNALYWDFQETGSWSLLKFSLRADISGTSSGCSPQWGLPYRDVCETRWNHPQTNLDTLHLTVNADIKGPNNIKQNHFCSLPLQLISKLVTKVPSTTSNQHSLPLVQITNSIWSVNLHVTMSGQLDTSST